MQVFFILNLFLTVIIGVCIYIYRHPDKIPHKSATYYEKNPVAKVLTFGFEPYSEEVLIDQTRKTALFGIFGAVLFSIIALIIGIENSEVKPQPHPLDLSHLVYSPAPVLASPYAGVNELSRKHLK